MPSRGEEVNDILLNTAIKSAQQKGETMPEVESRSNMKRKAVLRGETMPKGEGQSLRFGGWTHSLEELDAICDVAISSPQNPDGSMQTNHVMNPQFYADVKRLVVAVRRFYEMDYREALSGQPTASAERRLREALVTHEPIAYRDHSDAWINCTCGWGGFGDSGEGWANHFMQALQSVPSSPLCPREDCPVHLVGTREPTTKEIAYAENLAAAPSDGGQPEIWPGIQCLKFASAEDAKRAEKLFNDLTDEVERLKAAAPTALEKLRELEAKWRAKIEPLACGNTAAAGCVKMFADELHAIITPAPRPAEKD